MPFANYSDFDDCTSANSDKRDPEAYCGAIKHEVEDKMKKTRRPSREKIAEVIKDLKKIQKSFCK
jgi:tryptophanyl-tRNA synthetase